MTKIIAYTYDSDIHCVDCTKERFSANAQQAQEYTVDENNVLSFAKDSERNPIHAVFSTDEFNPNGAYCGDCRACIRPPYQV